MQLIHKKRFWVSVLFAQFLLFFALSRFPLAIEFFQSFFGWKKYAQQWLLAKIPFSVGDVLYVLLGCYLVFIFIKIWGKSQRNFYLKRLLISLNIGYLVYQLSWGMLYFQPPIIRLLPTDEPTINEAKSLAIKYLHRCKTTRQQAPENHDGVFMITDFNALEQEILNLQTSIPSPILHGKNPEKISNFKPSLFGNIMNFSGILGYYNPFTTEAQYNAHLPHTYIPFTLSHESAHQLGYAREQEANFIGYLIGKDSKNISLKYSTEYFVLKSLIRYLAAHDEAFVKNILENYSPKMKRDAQYEKLFFQKHQGVLDDFFAFTNDLFLKSNQQEGSVTYSYFVDLLIRYERKSSHL